MSFSTTRKEAKTLGDKFYYTGEPCKEGHVGPRRVDNCTCVECAEERSYVWRDNNMERTRELERARYHKDIEASRENVKLKYRKNPDYWKKWYRENKERVIFLAEKWRRKNRHKNNASAARYRSSKIQANVAWANPIKIERKYLQAQLKTALWGEQYDVDHIVPLRGKRVCGLHVENNLQVITKTANSEKSNKF